MVQRIALTGGIACGKSLAGDYLRQKQIPVIDADDVVHTLLRGDAELKALIRAEFGAAVFDPTGEINRPELGRAVFGDTSRRKLLESWIHPKTREVIERFYQTHSEAQAGVSIIPLLFESALEGRYDQVWLLDTEPEIQMQRLTENRNMSAADAMARIQSQMSGEEKCRRTLAHAHGVIIPNSGTPEALYRQLHAALSGISASNP